MHIFAVMGRDKTADRLPWKYLAVDSVFEVAGTRYKVVVRPDVEARFACEGCAFCAPGAVARNFCQRMRCSRWDRADGVNVWFVEEGCDG